MVTALDLKILDVFCLAHIANSSGLNAMSSWTRSLWRGADDGTAGVALTISRIRYPFY